MLLKVSKGLVIRPSKTEAFSLAAWTSLFQEPGWFDEIANQPGVLTARLATEVSSLETVTGAQLGTVMESICLIIASLVITFMYSWQLTLVNACFLPIMVASSAIQVKTKTFLVQLLCMSEL